MERGIDVGGDVPCDRSVFRKLGGADDSERKRDDVVRSQIYRVGVTGFNRLTYTFLDITYLYRFVITGTVAFVSIAFNCTRNVRRHERWVQRHFASGIWVAGLRIAVLIVPMLAELLGAFAPGATEEEKEAGAHSNVLLVLIQKAVWNDGGSLGWLVCCFITEAALWEKKKKVKRT